MGELKPPAYLPDSIKPIWQEITKNYGGGVEKILGPDLEAYCGQIAVLREARNRVAREGLVIADPKGNPIPHPAIAIEKQAQTEIRAWGTRFKKRS